MNGDPPKRGRFVVLDGVDGSGKSTQARRLVEALRERGARVRHLREPGSTPLGEAIRELLLARGGEIHAGAEALLFTAARRQMLEQEVGPALAAGSHVVCERFNGSTVAYQGFAGSLGEERVTALVEEWAGAPRPDLVLVLDLEPALAAERRGAAADRIEDRGAAFLARVAEGLRRYAERTPAAVCLDASGTEDEVHARILGEVERVL